jgi:hypothetical protein
VKSLFDLGLNNDGSLQAKSHQSYDKVTSIEKGQKWYAVTGYQVPPHQLQASLTRAIPKFLRKDIRNVGRGPPRPRTLLHYAEHHEIHKLNALIHDVALLNDGPEETQSLPWLGYRGRWYYILRGAQCGIVHDELQP